MTHFLVREIQCKKSVTGNKIQQFYILRRINNGQLENESWSDLHWHNKVRCILDMWADRIFFRTFFHCCCCPRHRLINKRSECPYKHLVQRILVCLDFFLSEKKLNQGKKQLYQLNHSCQREQTTGLKMPLVAQVLTYPCLSFFSSLKIQAW